MTLRLTLIAQGATLAARKAAFPLDEPLEDKALAAIHALTGRHWQDAVAFTSPKAAARQTAAALGLAATIDPDLTDSDAGLWAGQTIADITAKQPVELARWMSDSGFDGHSGESRAAMCARAGRWLQTHALASGHVVAVTHAAIIRAMILQVLQAPPEAFWQLDVAPLTLTDLRHDGRRWAVRATGCPLPQAAVEPNHR